MSKYIFIDCDGTLVPYIGLIPQSAKKALLQAKINGYKLVLTTGRYLDELTDDILEIGFDGFILNSGSYIQYNGEELYSGSFPLNDEKKLVDYLEDNSLGYRLETTSDIYQNESFTSFFDEFNEMEDESAVFTITDENKYRDDVVSVCVAVNDEMYYKLVTDFPEHLVYGYKQNDHYSLAILHLKGINKGTAIRYLSSKLDIKKEDTISIGDDYNDIAMFKETEISICMGQGNLIAQQNATYVTDAISKDGIYNALKHFDII